MEIRIRPETTADIAAIADITRRAFETLAISQHTEQFIIAGLRAAGALSVSLVAELDGRLVGHIAFSPTTMADGSTGWFGVGPLSVEPELQKQGIGTRLMQEGIAAIRKLGAKGCLLVGHPEYYRRFGFKNEPSLVLEGVPPEVFFCLPFESLVPPGPVAFHPAFFARE
jgi:putative acetyltransferase